MRFRGPPALVHKHEKLLLWTLFQRLAVLFKEAITPFDRWSLSAIEMFNRKKRRR